MKQPAKIPNNWQIRKIGDVCDVVTGSTPSTTKSQYWSDEIVWVTPYDLAKISTKYIDTSKKMITNLGLKSCSANLIPERSLVMSSRAPIGYFAINTVKLATNQGCKSFVCSNTVDVEYLYFYLSHYVNQIHKLGAGSTFSEVGKKALTNLSIRLPEVKEQKSIAEILSSVDTEIEKTQAIIDSTEKLKKGLMQKLFTKGIGHTKFKKTKIGKIPVEWEIMTLDDVLEFSQYGISKKTDAVGAGYPMLRMNNIKNGKMISHPLVRVLLNDGEARKYLLEKGDVLLNRTNSADLVGKTGIFQLDGEYIFASYLIRFRSNNKIMLPEFLNYYLNSSPSQLFLRSFATKAVSQSNINPTKLKKHFHVVVPALDEQKEIASLLTAIDTKRERNNSLKNKLVKLKIGLMQDLLSGRVRTL